MSSFTRKRGRQVIVYVPDPTGKRRSRALPRSETKHLDGQPDNNILYWIAEWEAKHGLPPPVSDSRLSAYVDRFVAYYRDELKKSDQTYSEHRRHLLGHVIPYFLTRTPPLSDPNYWPAASVQMLSTLRAEGLTDGQIYRCNIALRKFYLWLTEEKLVVGDGKLLVRSPIMKKSQEETPLKVFLSPEDALKLANAEARPDFRCVLLFGYFFSLRPQETFGLLVGDLRAGEAVFGLEASKTMRELKLFGGMAVHITRQKDKKKNLGIPKNNSKGWVACFNREAAKLLVETLQDREPSQSILQLSPNQIYADWSYPFALKDLRRASLYWLGHNTDMSQNQMMKHARQKSEAALRLYLRRPEEKLEQWTGLKVTDF